jgi:hypothetical protein
MLTVHMFAIAIVMSNGDVRLSTWPVPNCSTEQKIVELAVDLKAKGLIRDFRATCSPFQFKRPLDI